MNVETFAKQIEAIHGRLHKLYKGANATALAHPDLLPVAFKELGTASEALQIAVEELYQQNEELLSTRSQIEIQHQRYMDLFEFAPDAYVVTDAQGKIREANRAAASLFNLSQDYLVGKPLIVFVVESERWAFRSELNRQRHKDRVQELEVVMQGRGGQSFDASIRVAPAIDRRGYAIALRWLIRDISTQKRTLRIIDTTDCDPICDRPFQVYTKGEIIPLNPQSIWLVSQGLVKLTTMSENGHEVLLGLVGPDMPFGSSLTSLYTYQATALSKDVRVVSISLTEIAGSPKLAQAIFSKINQRLRQTESLLAISGQRRVKDRLYQMLLLLKHEFGESVAQGTRLSIRLTHEDLASACCTTRVTITRLLSKLQQQGKILFDSKSHIILKNTEF
ncbi:PAS domain S-box protein [Argonema galeatum]|uniref:PAS domain S-box protein n=1 Tax=Argonema galeatum TaxID=2942762 RepID=UPI0020123205|nr:PAS domain S-box protein [Argonema galeatum]MCL1464972.1 PAS domain S-box protein [Argonema galeatum A003/A1]